MEEKREITRETCERVWKCVMNMPHNFGVPLGSITMEPGSYAYNTVGEMHVPSNHWPELTLRFLPNTNIYEGILLFAMAVCDAAGHQGQDDEMTPKKIFKNGPVTGIIWEDGKKTLTRRSDDDSDDTYLALLNNYLRKETNNRGKYELGWGDAEMEALSCADRCSPNGMRRAAKLLTFLADATEMMGAE